MKYIKFILYFFLAITFYDLIFNGILEKSSVYVEHFARGGGNLLRDIRLYFCIPVAILAIIFSFLRFKGFKRILFSLIFLCIPLFTWESIIHFPQRSAEGFSNKDFNMITNSFYKGEIINKQQVLKILGSPIVIEKRDFPSNLHRGIESWAYTYMPSCGFGWDKRIIYFNDKGIISGINRVNEP